MVDRDPKDFIAIATALVYNTTKLDKSRHTMREGLNSSTLRNEMRLARAIGFAYRAAWRQRCVNLAQR
jgi:predicted O-linked N-acetylglucosamine transferase (SPINDLY family)